jgi:hypothetical protein
MKLGRWSRQFCRPCAAEYADCAYDPEDYAGLLAGAEDSAPEESQEPLAVHLPPAKLPPILENCAWMRPLPR